jgi:endonuclease YncB( thermonuclease family)
MSRALCRLHPAARGAHRLPPRPDRRVLRRLLRLGLPATLSALICCVPALAVREQRLPGPVAARVVKVLDGDTILVEARIWLDQSVTARVRLVGINAPELRSTCAAERAAAKAALAFLATRLAPADAHPGAAVILRDIRYGKYAGRVLARVSTPAGEDLAAALLAAGHARAYDGGPRRRWCR